MPSTFESSSAFDNHSPSANKLHICRLAFNSDIYKAITRKNLRRRKRATAVFHPTTC